MSLCTRTTSKTFPLVLEPGAGGRTRTGVYQGHIVPAPYQLSYTSIWQPELHRRHGEAPCCPFYARGISKIERSRTGNQKNRSVERLGGIEPPFSGWRPGALPLSYSRVLAGRLGLPTLSGGNVNETWSVQKGGPPFCAISGMIPF